MHEFVCMLQRWKWKVAGSALPSLELCSGPGAALRLRERGVGSGLQRVGWRAGAAGSQGRSAPSATQAVWVGSTRVSTVTTKAAAQEHGAVTLLSICPTTGLSLPSLLYSTSERWLSILHSAPSLWLLPPSVLLFLQHPSATQLLMLKKEQPVPSPALCTACSFPSFSHAALTHAHFFSSLFHLTFAYGWARAYQVDVSCWQCISVCLCYKCWLFRHQKL